MSRLLGWLVLSPCIWLTLPLGIVGCNSPAPAFDPFAPYGARLIPPPTTGSIGPSGGYDQSPTAGGPNSLAPSLAPVPSQAGFAPPGSIPQVASANYNAELPQSSPPVVASIPAPYRSGAGSNPDDWMAARQPEHQPATGFPVALSGARNGLRQSDRLEWIPPSVDPRIRIRQASANLPAAGFPQHNPVPQAIPQAIDSRPVPAPIRPFVVRGSAEGIGSDCGCQLGKSGNDVAPATFLEPIPSNDGQLNTTGHSPANEPELRWR